jgi:spore germination protein YaaH
MNRERAKDPNWAANLWKRYNSESKLEWERIAKLADEKGYMELVNQFTPSENSDWRSFTGAVDSLRDALKSKGIEV